MGFVKEHGRLQREVAREETADRIESEHDFVRNPHGRLLVPERCGKLPDSNADTVDMKQVSDMVRRVKEAQSVASAESEEVIKPTVTPNKKPQRPFRRCVRVFQPVDMQRSKEIAKASVSDVKRRLEAGIKAAESDEGFRQVPSFRGINKILSGVEKQFANFSQVIEYMTEEMTLSGASKPESFHITPMLLDGPPGVGKTAFAQQIASVLGLPYRKLSAGGLQHAFMLTGSATHWGNSQTGEIFNMIGRGQSACGVLLIDEVDKISDRQDYAILPALLDLLEPESARNFVDESLGIKFDASRLIVLMTSNRMHEIDAALLSRCRAFTIDPPGVDQKVLIAKHEHDKRNSGLPRHRRLELNIKAVEKLADENIDVRALIRAVGKGFANALMCGDKVASPILEDVKSRKRQIGFVQDGKSVH